MTNTCETCKHWKRKQPNAGTCCIRAPQVVLDPDGARPYTWFPQTLSDEGCGEHEPKPTGIGTAADTTPAAATGNVQIGDYVLATKYEDGDPADQWCIGFTSEYWPHKKRWMVVDSDGNNFRHNGFRRAEKITPLVGVKILRMMQAGACPDSMWTLRDAAQTDIDNPTGTMKGGV